MCAEPLYINHQRALPLMPIKSVIKHQPVSLFMHVSYSRVVKQQPHLKSAGVKAWTMLVPSLKRVRKMRLAFWNMPSFKLTTMN
jgi:hypothetical protein